MKKHLFLTALLGLYSLCLVAQSPDFKVERDTSGFILVQGAQRVQFDTVFVNQSLQAKTQEAQLLQSEVALLEQLLERRRHLQAVLNERQTLAQILNQARTCAPISSSH